MTAMELAHQMRRKGDRFNKFAGLTYGEKMSICLKQAHISVNRTKQCRAEARARFKALEERRKKEAARINKFFLRGKKKEFSEMDLAKAAFAADKRDKKKMIKVRYW